MSIFTSLANVYPGFYFWSTDSMVMENETNPSVTYGTNGFFLKIIQQTINSNSNNFTASGTLSN